MELEGISEIEVEIKESGPPGERGPQGLSAYEVYLKNGGTLSEIEWLESLKGETGGPGADGKDGQNGKDGYTPVKGVDYFTEEEINEILSNAVIAESDPTVPEHVKSITEEDIAKWNEGGGNSLSGEVMAEMAVYSEKEQVIGLWIDGKPLYRKVVNYGVLPNNDAVSVEHGISNIDRIVNFHGIALREFDNDALLIPYITFNTDNFGGILMNMNSISITIRTVNDRSPYNAYVTVEYTKTTDEPVNSLTYYPITKEYVDDAIAAAITNVLEGEY